jgi:hypothetical protein
MTDDLDLDQIHPTWIIDDLDLDQIHPTWMIGLSNWIKFIQLG